ncbi:GFA family protein [Pseudoroseicyclus tamaricis]|uniref:GFA family protein n=1 Tax=Pseudoroseicyclus tamaricis TaxID=2705421 RepID=A0A6B2JYR8_9RHOB|nr:GFA family protein [Pseudoroseicyclus tamaricis]NDV02905.1 GFA family protein [Pseudoroseicyclus tamaricis]
MTTGRCLCGAVVVEAGTLASEITGCFCALCARAGGGIQMSIEADPAALHVTGPVKTHRSSRLAERAWCDSCGSPVWFRYVEGPDKGYLELSPGLFDGAAGATLTQIVYADRAPRGFSLAGLKTQSQAEYDASHENLNTGGGAASSEGARP